MIAAPLTAGTRVGHYCLEARLDTGAFGEVWRASRDGHAAALKFINADLLSDPAAERHLDRLRGEIDALEILRGHPHIPALYDYGLDCARPFLAMQYIETPPLSHLIASGEILCVRLRQRLDLLRIVAETIQAVHAAGILHRDIKPSHIHGVTHPYLLDFSVAHNRYRPPEGSRRVGTRLYMPPDDGLPADERDDAYSFALVAYEVLFGRHPFYTPDVIARAGGTLPDPAACLQSGAWAAPGAMPEADVPLALRGADLARLDAIFSTALGPRGARSAAPITFVADLHAAILVPANEQYLDCVPDAATTLSLQFAAEANFTEDQVSRAARATEHGERRAAPRRPLRWSAAVLVSLLLVLAAVLAAAALRG